MPPTYSVVVVTWNGLADTVACIESLRRTVPPTAEVIVVDNASTDGTRGYLAEIAGAAGDAWRVVLLDENLGWCGGVNRGLALARGDYVVLLNSDVIATPEWLQGLRDCMDHAREANPAIRRVGLVGPVTNYAGGPQQVANPPPLVPERLDEHAARHRAAHRRQWSASFFLSGFCLMIRRECLDEVGGLDERFDPGGFDDNDLVLRAQERGWEAVIAGDVYVHHVGGASFARLPRGEQGVLGRRSAFLDKWRERTAGPKRLVAIYRVKNAETMLRESLDATARFADAIVVLDDGSTDGTRALCEAHPAVTCYEFQKKPFDERRDRNRLLELADALAPDWVIAVDADEVFEMDRARVERLMHLSDPHVKVLGFHWYTFWEPTRTYYRSDGIFGGMSGFRMFRWEPGLRIVAGTESGLHCGNIPQLPDGGARWTSVRVRHLGYDHEELRQRKLAFYRRMDPKPRAELVGNTDYGHLVSANVWLRRYQETYGVSLCVITRNEAERLDGFLSFFEPYVDEICVVDNGSTDRTVEIARRFTDRIDHFPSDRLDLDQARNRCLALATKPWILSLDPDEEIALGDLPRLQRLMDDPDVDGYSFHVSNHQKDAPPVMTLAVRLFRNDPRIRFSRPVHETIEEALVQHPELVVRPSHVPLQHFGYLKDDTVVEGKVQRYYERNRAYRDEHPDDAMPWYNEALHHLNEGREDDAIGCLLTAMQRDPSFLSPRSQLAYILQERAIRLWQSLASETPTEHPMQGIARQSADLLRSVTPPRVVVGAARARERE